MPLISQDSLETQINKNKLSPMYFLFGEEELLIEDSLESLVSVCLLYTSDAADERSSVDLGGRRIIKKKIHEKEKRRGCK